MNTTNINEQFYISYRRALQKINQLNIKTRTNKEIKYNNLVRAINIMDEKHHKCRWKFKKYDSGKKYILKEGYYWLIYVFFQNDKKMIDADIEFFEIRIKQYEELMKVSPKKIWKNDMKVKELEKYFNKEPRTIRDSLMKLKENSGNRYILKKDKEKIILKEGVEWLSKNYFKTKYLEELEKYKMELTEKYIRKGYIYDYTNIIGI